MKIRHKILLFVLLGTIIVFISAFSFLALQNQKTILQESKKIVKSKSLEAANYVIAKFNNDMGMCRALANSFIYHRNIDSLKDKLSIFTEMQSHVARNNPEYVGVWSSWQLSEFDPNWGDNPGRINISAYRKDGVLNTSVITRDIGGITNRTKYHAMMDAKREQLWIPYFDITIFKQEDNVLETTLAVPVLDNGKFEGMVGIDVELRQVQKFIKTINPYENSKSYAVLIAQDGSFVSHPSDSLLGKFFIDYFPEDEREHNIIHKIKSGEPIEFESDRFIKGENCFISFAPIKVGNSMDYWSLGVIVPMNVITKQANAGFYISILSAILGILLLIAIVWYISLQISKPIVNITNTLKAIIDTGDVLETSKIQIKGKDELAEMSLAVNRLMDNLLATATFAKEVGQGHYEVKYHPLSEKDLLGNSLIEMRDNFIKADAEENRRKEEDRRRNWMQEGLAKFSDILRISSNNLSELSMHVITNLVKYINCNQGGVFILNDEQDEEKFLELTACFAYDRKKFLEKKIQIGEGLIGACYLEKKTIYLKQVPDDYIAITSGLGGAAPKHILIVPLISNEKTFGIIELASFNEFQTHEIEFVEKLCETTASTISIVKINIRTSRLLEQSQHQSEQLRSQEEEMRQNMEELQATQEEMSRKNAENSSVMQGINNTLAIIEYDMEGNIKYANPQYLKVFDLQLTQIQGKNHKEYVTNDLIENGTFDYIWQQLQQGESVIQTLKYHTNKGEIYTQETYTPIKDNSEHPFKVLNFIVDITDQKHLEIKTQQQLEIAMAQEEELRENMEKLNQIQESLKQQEMEKAGVLDALNSSTNMIEYDLNGYIIFCNDSYIDLLGLKKEDVIGKHHKYKINMTDEEESKYEQFWNDLKAGKLKKQINHYVVNNKPLWLLETYTPIRNKEGKIYKILKIALDITESKLLEQQLKQFTEELKAQEEDLNESIKEIQKIKVEEQNKDKELTHLKEDIAIKNSKLKQAEQKIKDLERQLSEKKKK